MDILDKLLDNIAWIVIALSSGVGIFIAARRRKKEGPRKFQELLDHLTNLGISAQAFNQDLYQSTGQRRQPWGDKSLGSITLSRQAIESIETIGVAQQYGVNYFLDYVVPITSMGAFIKMKKTKMTKRKEATVAGKTMRVEWKGDQELASRLNLDESQNHRIVENGLVEQKDGIVISPDLKKQRATIRTNYHLPAKDQFDVMDAIAKHIKAVW